MKNSLIGITYDLLAFHRAGNDGLFDRCFEKATKYYSFDLDQQNEKKLRNWSYKFLSTTGYLDVARIQSKWSLSPAALVQCHEETFVLLGGSRESEAIRDIVPKNRLKTIPPRFSDASFPAGVHFFPEVLQLNANLADAVQLARKIGIRVSAGYQDLLFKNLPSLSSILESVLSETGNESIFEPYSAKQFSVPNRQWTPRNLMRPDTPGLYKNDFKYSAPKYYLAVERGGELNTFLVEDRDWAVVCFCALFDTKISIQYAFESRNLTLSHLQFAELRLPTLLERCLRSGILTEPELTQHGLTYGNLSSNNLWKLMAKFPIFALQQQ